MPTLHPTLRMALAIGWYTALVVGGVVAVATIIGAPVGVPMLVVGAKRGWKLIRNI